MPRIELHTFIKAERQIVFDLSRSVDLHKHSTKETKEDAIAGRTTGLLELNETVTWRARHLGVYQKLTSKITEFNSPEYFVDEMIKGAFKSFRHEHKFLKGKTDHVTTLIDIFEYESPLGILGRLADIIFLKKYMTAFLRTRNNVIKDFAETEKWRALINEEE